MRYFIIPIGMAVLFGLSSSHALAQAAGGGAEFNRKDRQATEVQRLKNYDKPVYKDPLGNALIGGAVSGVVKSSVSAGASSVVTGTAVNTTKEKFKKK